MSELIRELKRLLLVAALVACAGLGVLLFLFQTFQRFEGE